MQDHLKEIIALAYKTSPIETEYHLFKFLKEQEDIIEPILDDLDSIKGKYSRLDIENIQNDIAQLSEMVESIRNYLPFLRSEIND